VATQVSKPKRMAGHGARRMNLSREMDHESRDKFRFELVPEHISRHTIWPDFDRMTDLSSAARPGTSSLSDTPMRSPERSLRVLARAR